jgi:transcriptional regulator with XRE-family HTH domain
MTRSSSQEELEAFDAVRRSFGKRIAGLREQQGRSQQQLAEDCGIHLETIQQIENGEANIPISIILRLSEHLRMAMDRLFLGIE